MSYLDAQLPLRAFERVFVADKPLGRLVRHDERSRFFPAQVAKLVWFDNSWGPWWGKAGRFAMSFADVGRALADSGDATFPVPL